MTKQFYIDKCNSVAKNAYSPYSNIFVGSLIISQSGNSYTGTNVENSSYGLTSCAERNAIFSGIATEGKDFVINSVYISAFKGDLHMHSCPPCGACRQVISEFSCPDTLVYYFLNGELVYLKISELLKDCFSFKA